MPDTSASHDAASKPQPEADELAKDLPGLPVEAWGHGVGERGFVGVQRGIWKWQRRRVEVPWEAVRTLQMRGTVYPMLEVVFADQDGAFRLCELMLGKKRAEVAIEAWREYVIRRAENEGVLRGDIIPLIGTGHQADMRFAMIIPVLVLMLLVAGSIEALIWDGRPQAWLFWSISLVGVLLLGIGVWLVVAPIVGHVGEWLAMRRWGRWELGPGGLVLTDGASFVTLSPSAGGSLTPDRAQVDEFDLRLRRFSTHPIIGEMLLALRERSGAEVSPARSVEREALWAGLSSLFVATAFWLARGHVSMISTIFLAVGALLICIVPLSLHAERRRLADSLARGRTMLERLGW